MKIETIYNKGVGLVNEDSLCVSEPTFGVFDGASGMEPYVNAEGKTGALIASSLASSVFSDSSESLVAIAHNANAAIRDAMRKAGVDSTQKTAIWATSGAVVRINEDTFDWVQIGDCLICTIATDGTFLLYGNDYNHDLESLVMWKRLAVQEKENIRELLNEQMRSVRNMMNIDYGVLNGDESMGRFLKSGTVPLTNIAHILLFTDGLFLPNENPEQPDDFRILVDLFLEGGLERIQNFVREKQASDPKCWKYPRFKQHDDIAAISLSFSA